MLPQAVYTQQPPFGSPTVPVIEQAGP